MSRTAFSPPAGGLLAVLLALSGLAAGCADGDSRPAVWSYISPAILQPNCATSSCHGPAAAVAGLDFSTPDSGYASLTRLHVLVVEPAMDGGPGPGCGIIDGVTVCERDERPLVIPYDPDESRLVNMLRARDAPRMPPDRPLAEADIRLIERWILDGARQTDGPAPPDASPDSSADGGAADSAADAGAEAGTHASSDAEGGANADGATDSATGN